MKLTGQSLVVVVALLSTVLAVTPITTAQGPGTKGESLIPATPTPITLASAQSPNFRQAAEAVLSEYLQTLGPRVPYVIRVTTIGRVQLQDLPEFKLPYTPGANIYWTGGPHQFGNTNTLSTYPAGEGSGLDFAGTEPGYGENFRVLAIAAGTVIDLKDSNCDAERGFGCWVAVRHDIGGSVAIYAHLLPGSLNVARDQHIPQGWVIGRAGKSGQQSNTHLHLELRRGGQCHIPGNCFFGDPFGWGDLVPFIDDYYLASYLVDSEGLYAYNYEGSAVRGDDISVIYAFPFLDQPGSRRKIAIVRVHSSFLDCNPNSTTCENNSWNSFTQFAGHGQFSTSGAASEDGEARLSSGLPGGNLISSNVPIIPQDTQPPSGDYTSPSNGATVGRTVHLAAWASDNQSGVREVHFTAKWSGQWHLVYNDTSAPYEYDWDLCAFGVPDGDIELGLDIWDNAGNEFHLHTVHPNPHITKSYNCSAPGSTWSVDYWNNKYLAGYPNWHNNESGTYIFRDWGDGGPGGIQVNEWSARFVRTVYFPGGDYRFHCQHDDGCRIYIDGQNRIDAWWDSSFDGHDWGGYLSPGNHEVKVEFYDNQGGARLDAWWQGPGFLPRDQTCDPNQWCAEYWGNRNLSGTPAIHRNEGETLWHDWGSGGPDPTFPADAFSSRFYRNASFTCGTYRFHIFADDGVRFWVDNVLRLDQWHDQATNYDVDVSLGSGTHSLKAEHYENGGGAGIHLTWDRLSECQPDVTVEYASTHYAKPGAAVDPAVRVRVTAGYLQGSRGDNLSLVGGSSLGAATSQPVYGTVNEGSTYTFDVVNSSSFRMTAPSAEGTYESRWRVRAAGNLVGPEATVRVVVDGTPPTIAIQSPTEGAYLNANAITVRAAPQDAGGIDQVQFFVGYDSGSGWAWYNLGWDLDGSDGWSRPWDASGVPDQQGVAFYAYAWDRAGNGAGTAVWDVTLDRTPPTTAIRPLAATQDSTALIVWWDASDNATGIDHFDLQKQQDGGAWDDWHLGVGGQDVGAWFVGEMGHRYGFRMRGVDRAGNAETYPAGPEAETYINYCSGDAYEADNGPAQASLISPGQSQSHNFCGTSDEDWVKFWAQAGKRYVLETGLLGFTTDTVLTLYDSDGTTVLAENDDIAYPDNLASRVEWKAQRDGWLYARVRHWDGRVAGNGVTYTLRLEEGYRIYLPITLRNW